jgi:proton-translocating NADH-quinone oxidoreductase chain M
MKRTLTYNYNMKMFSICILLLLLLSILYLDTNLLAPLSSYNVWVSVGDTMLQFGLDGLNRGILILTVLLMPLCLISTFDTERLNNVLYHFIFGCFTILLLGAFTTYDLLVFYIIFEAVLIPIFLLIGVWGARTRKIKAGYYLLFFTVLGSILFLYALSVIHSFFGTTNFNFLFLNIDLIPQKLQQLIWVFFLITFLVKIPSLPFHIWLPEAHVEAPTAGSIVLAGLLLKLGTFGILKYNILLFPLISEQNSIYVYIIALVSIFYASLITLRQLDLKRIIAYSSIAHINVVSIGLFSFSVEGLTGSLLLIIAHGIVSSALFFLIGILYDRYHSRFLPIYGGLATVIPLFSTFLFLFVLSNFSVPLTSNFIGELLVLIGLTKTNFLLTGLVASSTFLTLIYSLWFYSRLCFGTLNTSYIRVFTDVKRTEVLVLGLFAIWNTCLACYPSCVSTLCETVLVLHRWN